MYCSLVSEVCIVKPPKKEHVGNSILHVYKFTCFVLCREVVLFYEVYTMGKVIFFGRVPCREVFINPRHACAARITVVMSVCLSVTITYAKLCCLQSENKMPTQSKSYLYDFRCVDFPKNLSFMRYGVIYIETIIMLAFNCLNSFNCLCDILFCSI